MNRCVTITPKDLWDLSVRSVGDGGDSAVRLGDTLYIDEISRVLSKRSRGTNQRMFGHSMNECEIPAGEAAVIPVRLSLGSIDVARCA